MKKNSIDAAIDLGLVFDSNDDGALTNTYTATGQAQVDGSGVELELADADHLFSLEVVNKGSTHNFGTGQYWNAKLEVSNDDFTTVLATIVRPITDIGRYTFSFSPPVKPIENVDGVDITGTVKLKVSYEKVGVPGNLITSRGWLNAQI